LRCADFLAHYLFSRDKVRPAFSAQLIAGWSSPVARQAHNPAWRNRRFAINLQSFFRRMTKLYQAYVLQNKKRQFYIGLSENVLVRLQQHNDGISKWTRARGPWELIWASDPMPLSDARKLELLLKRQKGGMGFYALIGLTKSSLKNTLK
jgi:predicted GIY-YIG superfamily endonuclease